MLTQQSRYKIDVCQFYFNIDDSPIKRYEAVLEAGAEIFMNKTVSKKDAIRFIREKKCVDKNELSSFSISYETLCIDMIKDFKNKAIFSKENERYRGWLLQYDPTPFANWYHDCFYYFVVDFDFYQEIKHNRGLSDAINMQKISVKADRGNTNEKICDLTFGRH